MAWQKSHNKDAKFLKMNWKASKVPDSLTLMLRKDSVDGLGRLFRLNVPEGELSTTASHQMATVGVKCNGTNGKVHNWVHYLRDNHVIIIIDVLPLIYTLSFTLEEQSFHQHACDVT